jgi:excisionase family DNA binding protein
VKRRPGTDDAPGAPVPVAVETVDTIAARVAEAVARATTDSGGFLTLAEAANWARCSTRTLRRALRSGRLRASQPGGRGGKLLIAASELYRWLDAGATSTSERDAVKTPRRRQVERRGVPRRISIDELRESQPR